MERPSNSPNVYDGEIGQYKGMCTFFMFEDIGIVTAKADEQKTEATRSRPAREHQPSEFSKTAQGSQRFGSPK